MIQPIKNISEIQDTIKDANELQKNIGDSNDAKKIFNNAGNFEDGGKIIRMMADADHGVFRYGLNQYQDSDFEDPTYLGFTIEIDEDSAFFTQVLPFLEKHASTRKELAARIPVYKEFVNKITMMFNSQESVGEDSDKSRFIKQHYINSISGLDNLTKKFNIWKEDKLTFELYEDIGLFSSYISYLYNNLTFSYENGRELIPENLLKFNLYIKVSEIRNLTSIKKLNSNNINDIKIANALKNNVTSIVYKLYDCQFDFMKSKPFGDVMAINGIDQSPSADTILSLNLYFKSVTRQIFNPLVRNSISMNDNAIDLDVLIVGVEGNAQPTGQNPDIGGNLEGKDGEAYQKMKVEAEVDYHQQAFFNDKRKPSSLKTYDSEIDDNDETSGVDTGGLKEKEDVLNKLKDFNKQYAVDQTGLDINNDLQIQGLAGPDKSFDPLSKLTNMGNKMKKKGINTILEEKNRLIHKAKAKRNELVRNFTNDIRRKVGIGKIHPENVNANYNDLGISLNRLKDNMGNVVFDGVISTITGN